MYKHTFSPDCYFKICESVRVVIVVSAQPEPDIGGSDSESSSDSTKKLRINKVLNRFVLCVSQSAIFNKLLGNKITGPWGLF